MKARKCLSLLILFISIVSSSEAQLPVTNETSEPRLRTEQAVDIAREFCRRIGVAVTGEPTAQFPAHERFEGQPMHWQPRWHVGFKNQVSVEVVDMSGTIAWFRNIAWERQRDVPDAPKIGPPISKEDAIKRGNAVLAAAGDTEQLKFGYADLAYPESPQNSWWEIQWARIYAGIPYRHQQANVTLAPDTGAVTAFTKAFRTPPPTSVEEKVTLVEARKIALDYLTKRFMEINEWPPALSENKEIVRLDESNIFDFTKKPLTPRVAWVINFEILHKPRPGVKMLGDGVSRIEAWVDCQNGNVLRGFAQSTK